MSLLQRVTSIDGSDLRPPELEPRDIGYGTVKSLRRVISYDAIPRPAEDSQATAPTGGVTQYKVSVARRLGKLNKQIVLCLTLTFQSSGNHYDRFLLACVWYCLWFCSVEAGAC